MTELDPNAQGTYPNEQGVPVVDDGALADPTLQAQPDVPVTDAVTAPVPEDTEPAEYTTSRGTVITVETSEDGVLETVAVDVDGSRRSVEGDHYDAAVAVATLLNL